MFDQMSNTRNPYGWSRTPLIEPDLTAQPYLARRQSWTNQLARHKHPKALEIVDALPRKPAGKVLKTELPARFGAVEPIDAGESFTWPKDFCCGAT